MTSSKSMAIWPADATCTMRAGADARSRSSGEVTRDVAAEAVGRAGDEDRLLVEGSHSAEVRRVARHGYAALADQGTGETKRTSDPLRRAARRRLRARRRRDGV